MVRQPTLPSIQILTNVIKTDTTPLAMVAKSAALYYIPTDSSTVGA
ncbi:hypothetical protein L585_15220 [Pantoea ananatis BRT175]|nr:hypothetical protein L585_15220 [Pantoea ananatis BRT175]